ncbi:hypothetical protein EW146_g9658 [Bondarzewia mesenterica]|uniref:Uncharacterized protein n=1 Tax=Bondarzewia mesenterica TaxID=1095465 RepID=A0A4S4L4M3_9AGAM|nr:hypothetical protein EW146_g9658 [Bondarzewia mesenterica]
MSGDKYKAPTTHQRQTTQTYLPLSHSPAMFSRSSDTSYSYQEALRQQTGPEFGVTPSLHLPAANHLSSHTGTNMTVDKYKIPVAPQRHRQTEDCGTLLAGDPAHRVFPAYPSNDAYGTFS